MKEFQINDGTFVKSNNHANKIMKNLLVALLPIILFTIYKNGINPYINGNTNIFGLFYPLIFILIPTIISFLIELLYGIIILKKRNKKITEYIKNTFSIFPGLFLGLILPINTPILIVVIGAVFATVMGKLVYGGFGHNMFNPALVGKTFVIIIYLVALSLNISDITPGLFQFNVLESIGSYETLIEPHGSLLNFFVGIISDTVVGTSALLCLLAFVFLTITKSIKWKIPVVYILTVFAITSVIGNVNGLGLWYPLFQIFSGWLMFGAVFMATDPVTSPVTPVGQVLYGLFLGILTVVFRYLIPFPGDALISILIMNLFVKLLDRIGSKSRFNFKKSIPLFLLGWVLIIGCGFYIGNKYENSIIIDPNFTVISKQEEKNQVVYKISQKENDLEIQATLLIENGEVIKFTVLDETNFSYSKDDVEKYINLILKKQHDIDALIISDDKTGVFNILKKIMINTTNDYIKHGGKVYETDPNYNIIKSEKDDNRVIYEVTQKGTKDNIKLRIIFKHDVIDSITVIEQNESDFNNIIAKNYITTLIENQQVLEMLEPLDESVQTSNYLKQAVINTKKHYWRNYEK